MGAEITKPCRWHLMRFRPEYKSGDHPDQEGCIQRTTGARYKKRLRDVDRRMTKITPYSLSTITKAIRLANGDTINTWTSASFFIYANDFKAENITFENNAGFTAGQAVAVFAHGDRLTFTNCNFKGFQDVLFCSGSGSRQYYKDCYIEGTTDFIFGPATAVFKELPYPQQKKLSCHRCIHAARNKIWVCFF